MVRISAAFACALLFFQIPLPGKKLSVPVELMIKIGAPTNGARYPVVFKVDDPELSALRVIAYATGDLKRGRAFFEIRSLNGRCPDGKRMVVPLTGRVRARSGEDGLPGISNGDSVVVIQEGAPGTADFGSAIEIDFKKYCLENASDEDDEVSVNLD